MPTTQRLKTIQQTSAICFFYLKICNYVTSFGFILEGLSSMCFFFEQKQQAYWCLVEYKDWCLVVNILLSEYPRYNKMQKINDFPVNISKQHIPRCRMITVTLTSDVRARTDLNTNIRCYILHIYIFEKYEYMTFSRYYRPIICFVHV